MSAPIARKEWAARSVSFSAIGRVGQVFVHWTAGGISGGAGASRAVEEKALRAWEAFHVNSRGMRSIAYNVLVALSGRRYIGRGNGGIGSTGVAGGHTACCNTSSVAVCVTMGPGSKLTEAAVSAIKHTIADWERTGVTTTGPRVDGHRDAPGAATACPGDAIMARLPEIRSGDDDMTPAQEKMLEEAHNLANELRKALGAANFGGAGQRAGAAAKAVEAGGVQGPPGKDGAPGEKGDPGVPSGTYPIAGEVTF